MATTSKERYEAPTAQVVALTSQGIVCQSGGEPAGDSLFNIPGYNPVIELI